MPTTITTEDIARILAELGPEGVIGLTGLAHHFATALGRDDPSFDRDAFLRSCKGRRAKEAEA